MTVNPNPKLYPDTDWTTSSFSAGGQCVDVKVHGTEVWVRNSKRGGPMLQFTHPEWEAFIAGVKANEFDG